METELIKIAPDGDQWNVLWGANPMEGIEGFGDTPEEAMIEFAKQVLQWAEFPDIKGSGLTMKWAVNILKARIKKVEYNRDNISQSRFGIQLMDLEIKELKAAVKTLEESGVKAEGIKPDMIIDIVKDDLNPGKAGNKITGHIASRGITIDGNT